MVSRVLSITVAPLILLPLCTVSVLLSPRATAQLIPDNTLGAERSVVVPTYPTRDRIVGGASRGTNLFHSFREFNVGNGRSVYFANPAGIETILTRVTGSTSSQILGRLGVEGNASLFLLNPNGIVFGPNASLDIRGSFVASTADGIQLGNTGFFSATDPLSSQLLSVQPGALFLNALHNHQSTILNQASLAVDAGQSLTLHGGQVIHTGSLTAPGGTIQLLGSHIGVLDAAQIDVSAPTGGGTVLIGGDVQGAGTVPRAIRTAIGANTVIRADALESGNGGTVVVWADDTTGFYGTITARGGATAGNGGFVEVSGRQNLLFRGTVDTSAPYGTAGTLLLDPVNITIANGSGGANDTQLNVDTPATGDPAGQILAADGLPADFTISEAALEALSGNTNVVLQATNTITLNDLTDNKLLFLAGSGAIALLADADNDGAGAIIMADSKDGIYTSGRDITLTGASLTLGTIDTSVDLGGLLLIDVDQGGVIPPTAGTAGTSTFTFTVPDSGLPIQDLNVRLAIAHPNVIDLRIRLIPPAQPTLTLYNANRNGANFQDTILTEQDDANPSNPAPPRISTLGAVAPFSGQFRPPTIVPAGTSNNLSTVNGRAPGGTWRLEVEDRTANANNGTLFRSGETAPWGPAQGTQLIIRTNTATGESGAITLNATNGGITAASLNASNPPNAAGIPAASLLRATGDVNVGAYRGASLHVQAGGSITTGDITITGTDSTNFVQDSVLLSNGTAIALNSSTQPTIDLRAGTTAFNPGGLSGFQTATPFSVGGGATSAAISINGTIQNPGGQVWLTNQYLPNAAPNGDIQIGSVNTRVSAGNGGSISVDSRGGITTTSGASLNTLGNGTDSIGGSVVFLANGTITLNRTDIDTDGDGQSGVITLAANGDIVLNNGTNLFSRSVNGLGGAIAVNSRGNLTITGRDNADTASSFQSDSGTATVAGAIGGAIQINARSFSAPNGVRFNSSTFGAANAGDIRITVDEGLNLGDRSQIRAQAVGSGEGGNIIIRANAATFADNTQLNTETSSVGKRAGNVSIDANTVTFANNSDIRTLVRGGSGSGGDVLITTNALSLTQDSDFLSETLETGDAGDITIRGRSGAGSRANTVTLSDRASLSSRVFSPTGTGRGGDVAIAASSVVLQNADINASTIGIGAGGGIAIAASSVILQQNADINASTTSTGSGGSITVTASNQLQIDNSQISTATSGSGNAGDVAIASQQVTLQTNGQITAETTGAGQAGDITLSGGDGGTRSNTVTVRSGAEITTTSTQSGQGGDITVDAASLEVENATISAASTPDAASPPSAPGAAGAIRITTSDSVQLRGTAGTAPAGISVAATGAADAGSMTIRTDELTIADGAAIAASTEQGTAGDVTVNASEVSLTSNAQLTAATTSGTGGNVIVDANDVSLTGNAQLTAASTAGTGGSVRLQNLERLRVANSQVSASTTTGRAGNLTVEAEQSVVLQGNRSDANREGLLVSATQGGQAGQLQITTPTLSLNEGAEATVSSTGNGTAGNLTVAAQTVSLSDRAQITAETEAGSGGNIQFRTIDTLRLEGGSRISASTQDGQGGDLTVNTPANPANQIELDTNSRLSVAATGQGDAGTLTLHVQQLSLDGNSTITANTVSGNSGNLTLQGLETLQLEDGSQISASTQDGQGGDLTVNAPPRSQAVDPADRIQLTNGSRLSVNATGRGDAGTLTLYVRELSLDDDASITASTVSGRSGNLNLRGLATLDIDDSEISASTASGMAGTVRVRATDTVNLDDGGQLLVQATAGGRAGRLEIATPNLRLQDNSTISVSSTRRGAAGNLIVSARDVSLDNSRITAETVAGVSGDIALLGLDTLRLTNGSEISASTGRGQGGDVTVRARDAITLEDGSRLAATASDRRGRAGSLNLLTGRLNLLSGSEATVDSEGRAGVIDIVAGSVLLNQGRLTAIAGVGAQGNINLTMTGQLLSLSNNSRISATALRSADGGNVTLTVSDGFLLTSALGDNDILANAAGVGNGGNIEITTLGVFGLAEQEISFFSDINASSQFGVDGQVAIITPGVDPTQGLTELPEDVLNAANQVRQGCRSGSSAQGLGAFVITGRGGLPPDPTQSVDDTTVLTDLVTLPTLGVSPSAAVSGTTPTAATPELIEAQGWQIDPTGTVVLTAALPTGVSMPVTSCAVR